VVIRRRARWPQLHRQISPGEWQDRLRQPQDRTAIGALRRSTRIEIPLGEPGFVEALEATKSVS